MSLYWENQRRPLSCFNCFASIFVQMSKHVHPPGYNSFRTRHPIIYLWPPYLHCHLGLNTNQEGSAYSKKQPLGDTIKAFILSALNFVF